MEQALKNQKLRLEELKSLKTNHEKRNKNSQTETYLTKKLQELKTLFGEIEENNDILL